MLFTPEVICLILSVIYHRDPMRYYACAWLVILLEQSPSSSMVGFQFSFFPVNLHLVEICVAIQFLSMVIFTFPWKIAWMGYWKKLNKTPISSEQQSTLSLHQTYETRVFVPQGIRTYLKWLPWWLLFIKYLCEVKSVTMPTQIFHHLGFTLNSLDSREI